MNNFVDMSKMEIEENFWLSVGTKREQQID